MMRFILSNVVSGFVTLAVSAQSSPQTIQAPRLLPPSVQQPAIVAPTSLAPPAVKLPRDENLVAMDPRTIRVQRLAHQMVVTVNNKTFREFNPLSDDAESAAKLLRELMPKQWAILGKARVVVEYGLTTGANGEAIVPPTAGFPSSVTPIDMKTVRVEAIRGVWCVRDDATILFNFGLEKEEAEQCLGVIRKYGFNNIGTAGRGAVPAITYLFAGSEAMKSNAPVNLAALQAQQEKLMSRTGIEVPGVGTVGEKIAIDPRRLEVRREKNEYSIISGKEVIATFGSDEWTARDAVRLIQDARFNEFCRFGTSGVTFFLKDGQPPVQLPFHARTSKFDLNSLRAKELNGKWWMMDITGKPLLPAASETEANQLVKMVKAFQFDTIAAVGSTPSASMKFLAKSR